MLDYLSQFYISQVTVDLMFSMVYGSVGEVWLEIFTFGAFILYILTFRVGILKLSYTDFSKAWGNRKEPSSLSKV